MDKIYTWFKDVMGTGYEEVDTEDKAFFWFCVILAMALVFFILWIIHGIIDNATSYKVQSQGVILDKLHVLSTESTGVGVGMTSQGAVPVVTRSGSAEDWDIIVREAETGEVHKISVSMQYLYDSKPGQTVYFTKKYGGLTKDLLSVTLV